MGEDSTVYVRHLYDCIGGIKDYVQEGKEAFFRDRKTQDAVIRNLESIYWSDEDEAFIAEVPELPGCMAHGDTHERALQSANEAIQLWVATAKEFGDPVPQPKGRRLMFA